MHELFRCCLVLPTRFICGSGCVRLCFFLLVLSVLSCVGCEVLPQFITSPILTASAVSDNTIDIHVSVTINTMNGGRFVPSQNPSSLSSVVPLPVPLPVATSTPMPAVLYPVPSLSGGACTLADLKKQRSLFRVGVFESLDSPISTQKCLKNSVSNSLNLPATELASPGNVVRNGNSSPSNTWSSSARGGKRLSC